MNPKTSLERRDLKAQEEELIRRAQSGDRDAFGQLYARHQPEVRAFIANRLADRSSADDIAADTWEAAWKSIERFTLDGRRFVAWVIGIARHRLLTHLMQSRQQHHTLDEVGVDGGLRFDVVAACLSPEGQALDRQDLQRVARVLDALPRRRREALVLQVRDGLSEVEIADAMGVSTVAVHSLLHRARRQLHLVLDGSALQ